MKLISNKHHNKQGITLIELLTALGVFAVAAGMFYTVFVTNWMAYDERITRANLWQEMDQSIERITREARAASFLEVEEDLVSRTTTFYDENDQALMSYVMRSDGMLDVSSDQSNYLTLTNNLDFPRSSFVKNGESLEVNLTLKAKTLRKEISVKATTEIFPRN